MSTRQRLSHETTAETMTPAPLLLARNMDVEPQPAEDIGARRLRELAQRFSQGGFPASDDDNTLEGTDVDTSGTPILTNRTRFAAERIEFVVDNQ